MSKAGAALQGDLTTSAITNMIERQKTTKSRLSQQLKLQKPDCQNKPAQTVQGVAFLFGQPPFFFDSRPDFHLLLRWI